MHFCLILFTFCIFFYTKFLLFLPSVPVKKTKLNRGQVLETAVKASGLGIEEAAKKAGYTRSAYYKHKDDPNLDYHILILYGKAIKYDFTEEFPDMPKYLMEEPEEGYSKPRTLEDALKLLEQWKNKYLELLEKYNRMMEEKMGK